MMWVSDVVRDFDQQRRAALQRRRLAQQQQARNAAQAQNNTTGSLGNQRQGRQSRQGQVQRLQSGAGGPLSPAAEEETSCSEVSSNDTVAVEELGSDMGASGRSRDQSTPPPSVTPTEGSVTESDYSAGFNDVLSSLHTLSEQLDTQEMGVASTVRHRSGQ